MALKNYVCELHYISIGFCKFSLWRFLMICQTTSFSMIIPLCGLWCSPLLATFSSDHPNSSESLSSLDPWKRKGLDSSRICKFTDFASMLASCACQGEFEAFTCLPFKKFRITLVIQREDKLMPPPRLEWSWWCLKGIIYNATWQAT